MYRICLQKSATISKGSFRRSTIHKQYTVKYHFVLTGKRGVRCRCLSSTYVITGDTQRLCERLEKTVGVRCSRTRTSAVSHTHCRLAAVNGKPFVHVSQVRRVVRYFDHLGRTLAVGPE